MKRVDRPRKHGPKAPVTFKRNFLPAIVGIGVTLGVLGAMNGQWLYAQYQYRTARPIAQAPVAAQQQGADSATDPTVDPNPELGARIEIPRINVQAPVQIGKGTAEWQIQRSLQDGVVHYDAGPLPGEPGNVVIFGHSSGQLWAPGNFKFIFTLLDKLEAGDVIYVYNGGIRYTYTVSGSQVVAPSDVGVLNPGPKNELTLITCTPVGTSTNRLIVSAEQTAPAAPVIADPNAVAPVNLDQLPGSAR